MDLLEGTGGAPTRPRMPSGFQSDTDKLIVVGSSGGNENPDGDTFDGIIRVECYAPAYLDAVDLAQLCETKIDACPATEIGPSKWLVDRAGLWTGPVEQPDDYPDDRRITSYYLMAVRRQVRPT
jgi:hypothetical protein